MAVSAAAKLRAMDDQIASLSTSDLRDPLYSSASDDDMVSPAQVEATCHADDALVDTAREIVQTAIHNAVALCKYVDTILIQAIQYVQREGKENDEETLKPPQADATCEERYKAFRSISSSSSVSTHKHPVDKVISSSAIEAHTKTEFQHGSPTVDHKHKLLHSDSSGDNTPIVDNVEITNKFRSVNTTPLVHAMSLEEDAASTPIIEFSLAPTCTNSSSHPHSHDEEQQHTEEEHNDKEQNSTEKQNIEEKQNNEVEEKHEVEEIENVEEVQDTEEKEEAEVKENVEEDKQNYTITVSSSKVEEQTETDDNVGELKVNGQIKINIVPSTRHDDGSLSPEPSFSKVLVSAPSSKSMKKDDTLDGKIFGNFLMHQSDSLPSFPSNTKLVDPDSISLVINQCNEEDMEHSDEEILIGHSMGSTSFIDEFLDSASLDSTNFSQESRDNLVFPNSPVALRHNKESIVRRRYDAGRFDETSPVKEEEKNGFAEFAELFETTFQMSRNQRERSSSPHSNKVASVFVLEGSHSDEGPKVGSEVVVHTHTCCEFG